MSAVQTLSPSTPPLASRAANQPVWLFGLAGTFLPLAILSLMYLLAPWPLSDNAVAVLRTANRVVGAIVLAHWILTALVAIAHRVLRRSVRARSAGRTTA